MSTIAAFSASIPVFTIVHPSIVSMYGSWSCAAISSGKPIFSLAISRSSAITWCVIGITTSHPSSSSSFFRSLAAVSYTGSAVSIAPPKAPFWYRFLSMVSSPMIPTRRVCPPALTSMTSYSGSEGWKSRMLLLIHFPLYSWIRSRRSLTGMSVSWLPKHTYCTPHPPTRLSMSIMPLPLSRLERRLGARKSPGSMTMVLGM
mmetsp:Transcript_33087/g.104628  ORF Transcript_33087/g.104628 Transcript_33087/m.104628 type:complete len:202 (-) Transcript_33087:954-1559(-)